MEEELETPEGRLGIPSEERYEVGGAKKPMPIGGAEDVEVTGREDDAAHRGALEARTAGLAVRHQASVPGWPWPGKAAYLSLKRLILY
ncbi:MAG TPA: hypothetical protein VIE43_16410 [Thermoanaerobaculia bacterium]|nr:hypothetical protein [Thermoanaerobaculia bacterium]